jgi:hypothetical protein
LLLSLSLLTVALLAKQTFRSATVHSLDACLDALKNIVLGGSVELDLLLVLFDLDLLCLSNDAEKKSGEWSVAIPSAAHNGNNVWQALTFP